MRALLYKDLVVNRSTILTYLVLAVVASLCPYVGGHWVFTLSITLVLPIAYLQQEHKEKWFQLAAVLPYSPWAVVGARMTTAMTSMPSRSAVPAMQYGAAAAAPVFRPVAPG